MACPNAMLDLPRTSASPITVPVIDAYGVASHAASTWGFRSGHLMVDLGVLAVFGLSFLSWKYVEQPCRRRQRFPRGRFVAVMLVVAVLLIAIGIAGARFFSPKAETGVEAALARALLGREMVYATNMNERRFITSRILLETLRPETLVIGSSRMMQVREGMADGKLLNLAVSGASLEDHVAIAGLAFGKFTPKSLLIGADPWLFNSASGQKRWRSIAAEYEAALRLMTDGDQASADALLALAGGPMEDPGFHEFYRAINLSHKIFPQNDLPELRAKIRSDGSRIYDSAYANRSPGQILRGIEGALDYSMKDHVFDPGRREIFEKLVTYSSRRARVALVLSPYHPALYRMMERDRREFLAAEAMFIEIGGKLGVDVVGSYDPAVAGCDEKDFHDVSHPKDSCLAKVLSHLARR